MIVLVIVYFLYLVVDVGRCYMLVRIVERLRVLGEQLVLMVQIIFFSKSYGLYWKEMRVDDWGFWVVVGVVGFAWDVVGGDWCGGC